MEESGHKESGMNKATETKKRNLIIVFSIMGLLLVGAGALLYFYGLEGNDKSITLESVQVERGSSIESNNIENEQPKPKAQILFDNYLTNTKFIVLIELNDDGSFSNRITLKVPEELHKQFYLAGMTGDKDMIYMIVFRSDAIMVYNVDLKTKMFEYVLTVPPSEKGIKMFQLSPDFESVAFFTENTENEPGKYNCSEVVLINLKTGETNELDLGTGKYMNIYVRNGGRVICKIYLDETEKSVEVSLFSKEHNYQAVKLFNTQESGFSSLNNFQVSRDASRIFFVDGDQKSIVFDVPKMTLATIKGFIHQPLMSYDGKMVASSWKTQNKTKVKIIDLEKKKTAKEFELTGEHHFDFWSNNGKFLFFDQNNLKKFSLDDGTLKTVKDKDGNILNVSS